MGCGRERTNAGDRCTQRVTSPKRTIVEMSPHVLGAIVQPAIAASDLLTAAVDEALSRVDGHIHDDLRRPDPGTAGVGSTLRVADRLRASRPGARGSMVRPSGD